MLYVLCNGIHWYDLPRSKGSPLTSLAGKRSGCGNTCNTLSWYGRVTKSGAGTPVRGGRQSKGTDDLKRGGGHDADKQIKGRKRYIGIGSQGSLFGMVVTLADVSGCKAQIGYWLQCCVGIGWWRW